jgi:hypothetical protein
MAHKIHLSITEMYYTLFNCFPERLIADCLPPSFKLHETDGEYLLEPLLLIRGDALHPSLLLVCYQLHISQAPGGGCCLSIGYADLELQSLVSGHVCCPLTIAFGSSLH